MSAGQRYSWWTAFNVANEIVEAMAGAVERIAVAGSIRRGRADVGDIEIVYIPNANSETRLQRLVMDGMLNKPLQNRGVGRKPSPTWGAKIKFAAHVKSGVPVQFFAASAENWGYILWLRTGPGDANAAAVTKKGMPNHAGNYGILPHDVQMADGAIWRLPQPRKYSGDLPPGAVMIPTPDEFAVFAALGIEYMTPPERSVQQYHALALEGARMVGDLPARLDEDWVWSPSARMWQHVPDGQPVDDARLISEAKAMGTVTASPVTKPAAPKPALRIDVANRLGLTAADFNGQRTAILGISGSGKSNTAAVVIEELAGKIPMTIIDVDGDYYRLRDGYDFKLVSAASRADLPLDIGKARALARESIGERKSFILDFSDVTEDEMFDYLLAYMGEVWAYTQIEDHRRPYLIAIEEAHVFFPQSNNTPLTKLFKNIALRGRKRGIGTLIISQRSPNVNKDVLTQCGMYLLHRVDHPRDISVYCQLVPRPSLLVTEMVNRLQTGHAIFKRGDYVDTVQIRKRNSVHTGITPELEPA